MSETEVLRLRLEVAELRALVHQLADRIAVLEASEGFEVVPPASSASRGSPEGLQSSPNPFGLGSPSGYPRTLGTPTPLPRARQDQEPAEASESGRDPFRASVAREIGRFLGRAVRGGKPWDVRKRQGLFTIPNLHSPCPVQRRALY